MLAIAGVTSAGSVATVRLTQTAAATAAITTTRPIAACDVASFRSGSGDKIGDVFADRK